MPSIVVYLYGDVGKNERTSLYAHSVTALICKIIPAQIPYVQGT